jgi:hypothetical protein
LVALETASLLRADGEVVSLVGLVDTIYDRRYWPLGAFVGATARRTGRHLRQLITDPRADAFGELRERAWRLTKRLTARVAPATTAAERHAEGRTADSLAAMAKWEPRRFDGSVVLFTTGGEDDFGCDPAVLWRPWVDQLDLRRVSGNHLAVVRDPHAVRAVAEAVDIALQSAETPQLRALLATTFAWEGAGRLAIELAAAGFAVEAIGPRRSVLHRLPSVTRSYRLSPIRPVASLRKAVLASSSDLIIPFDDQTRRALHETYDRIDPAPEDGARLRHHLRRSLGPPEMYSELYSRAAIMDIAQECGLRCPPTARVETPDEVTAWMRQHGSPAVLKTDGSWGGREVIIAHDTGDAVSAWRRLRRPTSIARISKRLVIDHDPWPLRARIAGRRPLVSIQAYVSGRPGNVAVACLDGKLLGAVQAEVLRSDGALGPSTVLRITDHPEMRATAQGMVQRLELSGLCGFDFVLEDGTDRAYVIELNPRATPTSHLISADGVDLLASLRAAMGGDGPPPARTSEYPDGLVALFPQELQRDPTSTFLTTAYHDVPHSPELVATATHPAGAWRRPRRRTMSSSSGIPVTTTANSPTP